MCISPRGNRRSVRSDPDRRGVVTRHAIAIAAAASISIAVVSAQFPPAAIVPTGNAVLDGHVAAAKAAAGSEWVGLYTAVCGDAVGLAQPPAPRGGGAGDARRGGGGGAQRGGGPPAAPARETWHAEPVKVFDNLYYVGMTEYSAWAITTSEGIILLDAIYDYSIEDEVVGGLKK